MALLKAFGPLEYGCKTEDGEVGVCLEAVFEAVAVDPASACK
jgi:hypothetical protein